MKKLLPLFALLLYGMLSAQCPTGDLIFERQGQLDSFALNFPDCEALPGNVYISERVPGGITNLGGLTGVQSISGYLYIERNADLLNLSGLNKLRSVGGAVHIAYNKGLTSLAGLDRLSTVGGFLDVWSNPSLIDLFGLSDLVQIDESLFIGFNDALTTLEGLNKLAYIGNTLDIGKNNSLTDLTSLHTLTSINGCLNIYDNASLNSLTGLDNIDPESIKDIEIVNSGALSQCEVASICNYLLGGGSAMIDNNASGCNTIEEVVAACASALPVEITHFAGLMGASGVQLKWTTSAEFDNLGFQVERSNDGIEWKYIGFVEAQGTSAVAVSYQFTDATPFPGSNYYRLKQLDFNGQIAISPVIVVRNKYRGAKTSVYPNPASEWVTFSIQLPEAERMRIRLTDHTGRLIWNSASLEETSYWEKEFQFLKSGVYLVHAEVGKAVWNQKVVIIGNQ